jgi:altronate hydrolase
LIEISPAPRNDNCLIHLDPRDNVAVARVPLEGGRGVSVAGAEVVVRSAVQPGHKIALRALEPGAAVLRYGQMIGRASQLIEPGEHVHLHNLRYEEPTRACQFPDREIEARPAPIDAPTFLGYPRTDGRAGTRNYIAVVAASNCSAHVTDLIARSWETRSLPPSVDGVAAFPHGHGCGGVVGHDKEMLQRTIAGVLDHPNVFAAILIGLGCEGNQVDDYMTGEPAASGRLVGMVMQSCGGTSGTVEEANRRIAVLVEQAAAQKRVETPLAKLVLGLNCGGSDSFSGITANPALGVCSDLLTSAGATSVLAETPEIFGAEHLLVERAVSRSVAERLLGFIEGYKRYVGLFGCTLDDNPAAGNKEGGLTTIVEKSLGAVSKGGKSALVDAIDYSERIRSTGLVFMNTPGYDPPSLAGLAAGGVNVIAFTTGRGSAIGFPTIPVVKIASNSETFRRMRGNMEINAGAIADGLASHDQVGREILDAVLRVASGEKTASERFGHREFVPWRYGPVL